MSPPPFGEVVFGFSILRVVVCFKTRIFFKKY